MGLMHTLSGMSIWISLMGASTWMNVFLKMQSNQFGISNHSIKSATISAKTCWAKEFRDLEAPGVIRSAEG